jgi:hypothetical protein
MLPSMYAEAARARTYRRRTPTAFTTHDIRADLQVEVRVHLERRHLSRQESQHQAIPARASSSG